jgi:hypothetical protein
MRFYLGWTLLLAPLPRARRTRRTLIANAMPDSTNPSTGPINLTVRCDEQREGARASPRAVIAIDNPCSRR